MVVKLFGQKLRMINGGKLFLKYQITKIMNYQYWKIVQSFEHGNFGVTFKTFNKCCTVKANNNESNICFGGERSILDKFI